MTDRDITAAATTASNDHVSRLVAIVLRSPDADALARFYREAFDFVAESSTRDERRLALGGTHLRIERAGANAAPCFGNEAGDVPGWSPLFQHFAICVADIDAAMARLGGVAAWRPISTDGPQRLPANAGGVTAFKFRDPDGHPLELLAFPDRRSGPLFAAIDHSAIAVADVDISIAFYERLGLVVDGRTLNAGIEQERLDGIVGATVDVVSLRLPSHAAPHVELLGYRGAYDRGRWPRLEVDDVAATRLVFEADNARSGQPECAMRTLLRDPDGHLVTIGS